MFATSLMKPVEIGIFAPGTSRSSWIREVEYIATGFKTVHECRVGDTIMRRCASRVGAVAGMKSQGFCRTIPSIKDYTDLRVA